VPHKSAAKDAADSIAWRVAAVGGEEGLMLFPYTLRRDTHRGHIVWFAESCFLIGCYGIGVTTEEAIRDLEFKESRGLAYTKQLRIPPV